MLRAVARQLTSRKSLYAIEREVAADEDRSGPKLRLFDLLCIGVGSTIGSGVFILTSDVLPRAGPSAVLSWFLAGLVCLLSAFSYIELSMRVPTSGSCYAYAYHALGELAGVVGALCLTLEYGVAGAGVARGWSRLVAGIFDKQDALYIWYPGANPANTKADMYIDVPAGLVMLASVALCSSGLDVGKAVINTFTVAKVLLVSFLVAAGFLAWRVDIFDSVETFFPHGFPGTMRGVSALFFGFIGFDEVCCLAGRAENPARTMPRALAGTLAAAAGISMVAQLSLAGLTPSADALPWPEAFGSIGWRWARLIASAGEATLLPLVVLLSFLPQPELLGSMSKDGLIPSAFSRTDAKGTFAWGSNASGAVMVAMATFVPFEVLWNMISLGVLLSFNLTNSSLIMMRYGNGGELRCVQVQRFLAGFWLTATPAAYLLWRGCISPWLDGIQWHTSALAAGIAFAVGALLLLVAISLHEQVGRAASLGARASVGKEGPSGGPFLAPGVPFIPGLAIFCNLVLMSTMPMRDHAYLAIFLALLLTVYFEYSRRRVRGKTSRHRKGGTASVPPNDASSSDDTEADTDTVTEGGTSNENENDT